VTTLARVVFLALVAATFGAFFVAQRLKGAPPVVQLQGQRWFSPNGDGRKDHADLIDAAGNPIRRLVTERAIRPSSPVHLRWDGRTDSGAIAPDGVYRVRGTLLEQGRSVVNPKLITLDTTPPRPRVVSIKPGQVVGPKAPEMAIRVSGISRRSATRFRVIRTDAGAPQVVAKGAGVIARRIREEAQSHGVPIVHEPVLTRALYRSCDIGALIPIELYEAVAHLLAFVFALRSKGRAHGYHELPLAVPVL
jgi:type III secretion system FlhB-like substrate exporter